MNLEGKQKFKAKLELVDSETGEIQTKKHGIESRDDTRGGQQVKWQFDVPDKPYFKRISVELLHDS